MTEIACCLKRRRSYFGAMVTRSDLHNVVFTLGRLHSNSCDHGLLKCEHYYWHPKSHQTLKHSYHATHVVNAFAAWKSIYKHLFEGMLRGFNPTQINGVAQQSLNHRAM